MFNLSKSGNSAVLECPYCRKTTAPLPIRDGYAQIDGIHNNNYYKKQYNNSSYNYLTYTCTYPGCSKQTYSTNGTCVGHKNMTHAGNYYCKYKNKHGKYCNKFCTTTGFCYKHEGCVGQKCCPTCFTYHNNSSLMCYKHDENNKCKTIVQSGKSKGLVCGKVHCKIHKSVVNDTSTVIDINAPTLINNTIENKNNKAKNNKEKKVMINVIDIEKTIELLTELQNKHTNPSYITECTELISKFIKKMNGK
jgi:hypothetical protein